MSLIIIKTEQSLLLLLLLMQIRTGISTPFHPDDIKRIPITLSLYPEYMEEADEKYIIYKN